MEGWKGGEGNMFCEGGLLKFEMEGRKGGSGSVKCEGGNWGWRDWEGRGVKRGE